MSVLVDGLVDGAGRQQSHDPRAPIRHRLDGHVKARRDVDGPPWPHLSTRMDHCFVLPGLTGGAQQEDLRGSTRIPLPEEARPEDTRRVQYEGVAGGDEVGQVRKPSVLETA